MKAKAKDVINNIGLIIIVLAIIIFNIIIGANEKELRILPIGIFIAISFIILLIKKLIFKENLIKSKMDVAILLFMLTLTLPLIFKTYATYQGTVEFILKYFFVFTMYLLLRNVVDSKKKINILVSTTVFASLIPIIWGIDIQHAQKLDFLIEKLDLRYSHGYRISGIFGYPNALSIYTTFCIFLAINRIENSKNILSKIIYFLYIILGSYIVYISYSRVVLVLYILILLLYIGLKNFNRIKNNKKVIKIVSIIILILLICTAILIKFAIKYSKPLEITRRYRITRDFEPSTTYDFVFDISVIKTSENKQNTKLNILEQNRYFNEKTLAVIEPEEGSNKYKINITTSDDYDTLYLKPANNTSDKVIINSCYINGEEYKFAYKYIPQIISRLITTSSLKDASIALRLDYYKTCLKIFKSSPVIGHGGNAWKNLQYAYQDYPFSVKETHSFFFELLISYGIIGVAAFIAIMILLVKNTIKEFTKNSEYRKQFLSIFFGLIAILLYSITFDFTMSFLVIILTVFIYIGILEFENKENVEIKYIDYMVLLVISFIIFILAGANIAKYRVKDYETKIKFAPYVYEYHSKNLINMEDINDLEYLKNVISHEPYMQQNIMNKRYWNAIVKNLGKMDNETIIKYIDFGITNFTKIKPTTLFLFDSTLNRAELMVNAIKMLETLENEELNCRILRIKEQLLKEYKINIVNLQDLRRNNLTEERSIRLTNLYKELLQKVNLVGN